MSNRITMADRLSYDQPSGWSRRDKYFVLTLKGHSIPSVDESRVGYRLGMLG